jgi:phosphomevalonate kinase
MNTQTQSRQQAVATIEPNKLSVTAKKIDEIAAGAMDLFKQAGSFEAELSVAASMQTLRAMLTQKLWRQ